MSKDQGGKDDKPKVRNPGRVVQQKPPNVVTAAPECQHCTFGMRAPIMDFFHDENDEQRYFVPEPFPLLDDILTEGPEKVMQREYKKASPLLDSSKKPSIRWIHLPANNMSWVEVRCWPKNAQWRH